MRQQLLGRHRSEPSSAPANIALGYSDPWEQVEADRAQLRPVRDLEAQATPTLDLAALGYGVPIGANLAHEAEHVPQQPLAVAGGTLDDQPPAWAADEPEHLGYSFTDAPQNLIGGYESDLSTTEALADGLPDFVDPYAAHDAAQPDARDAMYFDDEAPEVEAHSAMYFDDEVGPGGGTDSDDEEVDEDVAALLAYDPSNRAQQPPQPQPPQPQPHSTLPKLADPAREVAHPDGWWADRRVDTYDQGHATDTSGKYPARQLASLFETEQEDATPFRGDGSGWSKSGVKPSERVFRHAATQHWNQDTIDAHAVSASNGKLQLGGASMDTTGATGVGTQQTMIDGKRELSGKGKFIYTMDKGGKLTAADAWAEHQEVDLHHQDPDTLKAQHELRMVNHSSLLGGEAAAGAGELMVEDGTLQQITDASGHYTPSGKMTANVVKELQEQGVDTHDVAMRLTRNGGKEQQLHASARELVQVQNQLDATGDARDARDVMTDRRTKFREDLEQNGQGKLKRHVDVAEVERKQREASREDPFTNLLGEMLDLSAQVGNGPPG
ncbi:MAG: hypothetical protein ABMA64_25365 [Myxococcota bacterium]